jgi:copper chaperone CopZ
MSHRPWIGGLFAAALLFSTTACSGTGAESAAAEVEVPAGYAKAAFRVDGMDCAGCVLGTKTALKKLAGVREAGAEFDEQTRAGSAWAVYDPAQVTPEQMMVVIRELGYTPTPSGAAS